jgi:hypothetical protein
MLSKVKRFFCEPYFDRRLLNIKLTIMYSIPSPFKVCMHIARWISSPLNVIF